MDNVFKDNNGVMSYPKPSSLDDVPSRPLCGCGCGCRANINLASRRNLFKRRDKFSIFIQGHFDKFFNKEND